MRYYRLLTTKINIELITRETAPRSRSNQSIAIERLSIIHNQTTRRQRTYTYRNIRVNPRRGGLPLYTYSLIHDRLKKSSNTPPDTNAVGKGLRRRDFQ